MDHNFYKVWYQHSKQVWWLNMHTFVANFLRYAATKYYWNWITFSHLFTKRKRVTFFWNTVYIRTCVYVTSLDWSLITRQRVVVCCRFLESEVELNDTIQEMHIIATTPELYHIVVELNTVQSLLQLLSHDNTGRRVCSAKCLGRVKSV